MYLHFYCTLIVCYLIAISVSYSDLLLTERTGQIIDKHERKYFNLFPSISQFESAELFKKSNDLSAFKIIYKDSSGVNKAEIWDINEDILRNLNLAIENYEYVNYKKDLAINWKMIVGKFIYPSGRLNFNPTPVTIKLINGEDITANLLHTDSMCVVLSYLDLPYDWNKQIKSVRIIKYSEINSFIEPYEAKVLSNINLFRLNLTYFRDISFFNVSNDFAFSLSPPEIVRIIEDSLSAKSSLDNKYEETIEEIIMKDDKFLHLSFSYSPKTYFSLLNDISVGQTEYWYGGLKKLIMLPSVKYEGLKTYSPTAELSLNISNKVRIGVNYSYYPGEEPILKQSSMFTEGYSISFFSTLKLLSKNLYSLGFWSRIEMNASMGLTYGLLKNKLSIYIAKENFTVNTKNFSHELMGLYAEYKLSYFFSRYISFDMNMFFNILKSYEFTEDRLIPHSLVIFMAQNTVNYSGLGLRLGLGLHL